MEEQYILLEMGKAQYSLGFMNAATVPISSLNTIRETCNNKNLPALYCTVCTLENVDFTCIHTRIIPLLA
jgi:hypothetical protein